MTMILAAPAMVSLFIWSNELLAEATSSPRTNNAASVAIIPEASLIASFESELRWCCGSSRLK